MITLLALIELWFIISIYRINKRSKNENITFNKSIDKNSLDYFGFGLGLSTSIVVLIYVCITYLP